MHKDAPCSRQTGKVRISSTACYVAILHASVPGAPCAIMASCQQGRRLDSLGRGKHGTRPLQGLNACIQVSARPL